MSEYGNGCEDCQRCTECGEVAFCLSQLGGRPCPHDLILCGECNIENCPDCRREAFEEMCRTGDYNPRADVLYDHTRAAEARHWWEHRRDGSAYDPNTNSYSRSE